jgi:hypothetical protein
MALQPFFRAWLKDGSSTMLQTMAKRWFFIHSSDHGKKIVLQPCLRSWIKEGYSTILQSMAKTQFFNHSSSHCKKMVSQPPRKPCHILYLKPHGRVLWLRILSEREPDDSSQLFFRPWLKDGSSTFV